MATDKKQVEIPGRLHSVATEGVVAGANEILDDNKGKSQQEINASVDDSLQENKTNIANEIIRATNAENAIKGGSSKSIQNLDSRLSTVEAHDTISMDGGSVVVGTAEDFTNRTTAGDAKIPTVGAILNGADEEPIAWSDNLVRSEGIKNSLESISGRDENYITSVGITTSRTFSSIDYTKTCCTDYIDCKIGDVISFYTGGGDTYRLGILDSDKNILKIIYSSLNEKTITIDSEDCAFLRMSFPVGKKEEVYIKRNGKIVYKCKGYIKKISDSIDEINDEIGGRAANFISGAGINAAGNVITSGYKNYCVTELIPIGTRTSRYCYINFGATTSSSDFLTYRLAAFDSNGNTVSMIGNMTTSGIAEFRINSQNATFIRFSFPITYKDSVYAIINGDFIWKPVDAISATVSEDDIQEIKTNSYAVDNIGKVTADTLHGEVGKGFKIDANDTVGSIPQIQILKESVLELIDIEVSKGEKYIAYGTSSYSGAYPFLMVLNAEGKITQIYRRRASSESTHYPELSEITINEGDVRMLLNIRINYNYYLKKEFKDLDKIKTIELDVENLKRGSQKGEIDVEKFPYHRNVNIGDVPQNYFISSLNDYQFGNASTTTSEVYAKYNELLGNVENIDNYSEDATNGYITRKKIGEASDGQPLLAYEFVPSVDSPQYSCMPKIIIIASQHGFEKSAAYATYYLMKNNINAQVSDALPCYLRGNVQFVIIPVANPSGFDLSTYKNTNGVNLNRNWEVPNWQNLDTNPDSENYGGVTYFDQPETLAISNYIKNNHSDALLLIDFHTNGGVYRQSARNLNWVSMNYPVVASDNIGWLQLRKSALIHNRNMTELFRILYSNYTRQSATDTIGYVTWANSAGSTGYLSGWGARIMSMFGCTFEGFNGFLEGTIYGEEVKKANCELIGNFIKTFLTQYKLFTGY